MFPIQRMRRNRRTNELRNLVAETSLDAGKMIMPVFVRENATSPEAINGLPGVLRFPVDEVGEYCRKLEKDGVGGVLLFGIPSSKDENGTESYNDSGVVQESIRQIKKVSSLPVIADLCMCEYTSHGHCGILTGETVKNDLTLDSYGKIALSYARSGVDMIAPSGMMDGQVAHIRSALDSKGYEMIPIMGYSAKYASALYSPFREAAESTPSFGDRRSYQMDYRNSKEAISEVSLDIAEGSDIVMVKPAIFYLDVISKVRTVTTLPLAAYSVSGEYAMIMNAVKSGIMPERFIEEALISPFRAGADILITYFAEKFAEKSR